jgi:dolichol kinase
MATMWYINLWLAITAIIFMAWGDGITGVVRYYVYRKRVKGMWGSVAMAILLLPLGYIMMGWIGVAGAIYSTLVERKEQVNDNFSIPVGATLLMLLLSKI